MTSGIDLSRWNRDLFVCLCRQESLLGRGSAHTQGQNDCAREARELWRRADEGETGVLSRKEELQGALIRVVVLYKQRMEKVLYLLH